MNPGLTPGSPFGATVGAPPRLCSTTGSDRQREGGGGGVLGVRGAPSRHSAGEPGPAAPRERISPASQLEDFSRRAPGGGSSTRSTVREQTQVQGQVPRGGEECFGRMARGNALQLQDTLKKKKEWLPGRKAVRFRHQECPAAAAAATRRRRGGRGRWIRACRGARRRGAGRRGCRRGRGQRRRPPRPPH